uniref:RNA-dependent RNA polymerase n=1 Tax=Rhizoctonia solani mitovirus 39-Ph TaxID=3162542 RepID=A0AAU6NDL5_9VIRU
MEDEPCFINFIFVPMIFTLIAITAFLCLLHYTGTEYWVVYLVNQPIEYHLAVIAILVLGKIAKAFYNFYPTIVRFYNSLVRASVKLEQVSSELGKMSKESPFKTGGKRNLSTLRGHSTSGSSEKQNAPLSARESWIGRTVTPTTGFNILEAIRTKYVVATKMVPLTDKIGRLLQNPFTMNNILSMGKTTGLAWRIRLSKDFLTFVLKYNKSHGVGPTVKWLKAQHVVLQKALGQDILKSTISLGTPLSYSRLAGGGLPRIIPLIERRRILSGDPHSIRFWSGLFNLYRILKAPGVLKLETITGLFTGNMEYLEQLMKSIDKERNGSFFGRIPGFRLGIEVRDLSPKEWVLSRSASPSNKISAVGLLTDILMLNKNSPELWQEILYYLHAAKPKLNRFVRELQLGYELATRLEKLPVETTSVSGKALYQPDHIMVKTSIRAHGLTGNGHSQFALKEEPAGKIRLFALLDSVTQSTLAPLHEALFDLLRMIPNDGTFDQDESIRRSQTKAIKAGKAFSFDLTAATDRIPAALTASLIGMIFQNRDLGESWLGLMTKRDFYFNDKVAEKLKVSPGPYRYAVGQPMGGLSSWAGLAITHHWIVQLAASRAFPLAVTWNTDYEILGDDIVIFNKEIADHYLEIMKEIGCEINLTKSIISPNRPVFEFAKRTCWGENIVSGISIAQIRAGWRVAGRVANALSFVKSNLISKPSLLAIAISRYAFLNGKSALSFVKSNTKGQKLFALGTLSLFGTLYQSGKMSLKTLMMSLVNPHYEDADYSGEAVGLPLKASLELAFNILTNQPVPEEPFSKMERRQEVYDEYAPELATKMLQAALAKARTLYENQDVLIRRFANAMHFHYFYKEDAMKAVPLADLPPEVRLLYIQIENFANHVLGMEYTTNDPETIYDDLYALALKQAKAQDRLVSFEEASRWLDKVESLEFKLTLSEAQKPGKTILESAPILKTLRDMDPNRTVRVTYHLAPQFKELLSTAGSSIA